MNTFPLTNITALFISVSVFLHYNSAPFSGVAVMYEGRSQ